MRIRQFVGEGVYGDSTWSIKGMVNLVHVLDIVWCREGGLCTTYTAVWKASKGECI